MISFLLNKSAYLIYCFRHTYVINEWLSNGCFIISIIHPSAHKSLDYNVLPLYRRLQT